MQGGKVVPSTEETREKSTVSIDETVPARLRRLFGQLLRYGLAGGVAAIFDVATFFVVAEVLGVYYLLATLASILVGAAVNFSISYAIVFRLNRASWFAAWWRHLLASFFGLSVNLLGMYLMVDVLGLASMRIPGIDWLDGLVIVRVLVIGAVFLLNFTTIKFFAFKDAKIFSKDT